MKKEFIDNSKAISPIIGTILMVAITVIMAAIIANWSSGIKAPQSPVTVGLDVIRSDQYNISITITTIDPPTAGVVNLTASFNNKTGTLTKETILGNGAPNSTGYTTTNDFTNNVTTNYRGTFTSSYGKDADIGDRAILNVEGYNQFITITALYNDGTKKVLLSRKY